MAVSLFASVENGSAQTNVSSLALEQVLGAVWSNNPSIKAARSSWEAMRARVPQARAWEDPRVGLDVERSGTTRFDTFSANEYMIMQELPLSGKNRQRAKAAAAEAAAALSRLRALGLDLAVRARSAYFRYANAHIQLELNRKNELLLDQFVEISRTKYETGSRAQADLLMAETERVRNSELARDIERDLSEAQTRLNTLMNRPPDAALPPPEMPPAAPETGLNVERLSALALEHRPGLVAAHHEIDAAKARHTLARRQWFPDPEIRLEARQFNGAGRVISEYDTGIFFNIPWVNRGKYKNAIREAQLNYQTAEEELKAMENETLAMVRDQITRIETLYHHYLLFRDKIVPLARQSAEAGRIGYTADRSGFLELISAQRTVQEVEATLYQHFTEYLIAIAELESMVGVPLNKTGKAVPGKD